ncbi:adenylyl-sulfate kinase [Photobacterium kagoshimensis]|uniref:adenylyl-sulfate kinase n=1 Tax=Photobacterium kagoshimensis TaxID=2910242 RepID=UPI003D0DD8A2
MSTDVKTKESVNIVWHQHHVEKQQRAQQKKQKPCLLWFTGLSGAGKSTVAGALENRLVELGYHTYLLDGDNVRYGLCRDLGFSTQDRRENIRRIGEVANLMVDSGLIVLSAFISPHREERQMVRELVGKDEFFEVYVDTSLAECEKRDPKGLYKKARAGEIRQFTGIDSEYQVPLQPEIHLNAGEQTVSESVELCIQALQRHNVIS